MVEKIDNRQALFPLPVHGLIRLSCHYLGLFYRSEGHCSPLEALGNLLGQSKEAHLPIALAMTHHVCPFYGRHFPLINSKLKCIAMRPTPKLLENSYESIVPCYCIEKILCVNSAMQLHRKDFMSQ